MYLGNENVLRVKFGGDKVKCSNCPYEFKMSSKTDAVFFAQVEMKEQIENVLKKYESHFTTTSTRKSSDDYDDITSGKYYKLVKEKYPDLLSLTFNTDGVRTFKSKKASSFWPIQFVVNELPKQERF